MSVPKHGEYTSPNGEFKITIASANSSNGQIQGAYHSKNSPIGLFMKEGDIGNYNWVDNNSGGSGTAPFCISFAAKDRPEGYPYCLWENWSGYYTEKDTIVLSGMRSYVDNKGTNISIDFGTMEFAMN